MPRESAITVLVENTANQRGLLAEHGLAFWIEASGRRILFDTGQGMALCHNAEKLGVDLSTVDDVALSHGHYDHTGGLIAALPQLSRANVYAHVTAFRDRYALHPDAGVQTVRSPVESFDWLATRVGRAIPTRAQPVRLADAVWLTGQIPRRSDFRDTGGAFFLDETCSQPDLVIDDQALCMETTHGLVVVLGCAHAGVVNTLHYVRELTGETRIHAVLGGMHLLHTTELRLLETIRALRDLEVQRIGPAHCTGFAAMARLHHERPDRCFHCTTGTRIEFD